LINGKTPVEELISKVASKEYQNDIRMKDKSGQYPITLSCSFGILYAAFTIYLIKQYPYAIQQADSWDRRINPLHVAVEANDMEVVRFLLNNYHFLVYQQDPNGFIPLMYTDKTNNFEIMDIILNVATNCINMKTDYGITILIGSCLRLKTDMALKLLSYTNIIDINAVDVEGRNAIYCLFQELLKITFVLNCHFTELEEVVDIIHRISPESFNCCAHYGRNLLHDFALTRIQRLGQLPTVLKYCHHLINQYDLMGRTPFHVACRHNNIHAFEQFEIMTGFDYSIKDKEGEYPIHYLCDYMLSPELITNYITRYNVNVETLDNNGNTAVYYIIKTISEENYEDHDYVYGDGPEHVDTSNYLTVMQLLLNHNLFLILSRNNDNKSVHDFAKEEYANGNLHHSIDTKQRLKSCCDFIEEKEKEARYHMFLYFFAKYTTGN
jgi:ankyrin repeat protein